MNFSEGWKPKEAKGDPLQFQIRRQFAAYGVFHRCVLLLAIALMSGCFHGGGSQRKVAGDYRLEQWEDGKTYYLHKRGRDDSSEGGSVIGGTVVRIGWSSRFILAQRYSIFRGDPDGWMIIDAQSGAMSGPFSDADLRVHPESQGIQTYEVSEAWKRL